MADKVEYDHYYTMSEDNRLPPGTITKIASEELVLFSDDDQKPDVNGWFKQSEQQMAEAKAAVLETK